MFSRNKINRPSARSMYAKQRRGPNRCVKVLRAGDVCVGRVGMLSCLVKFSLVPGEIHASRLQLADLGRTVGTLPRLRHRARP